MKTIIRIVKKSKPHYYGRHLVYMTYGNNKSEVDPKKHLKFIQSVNYWNDLFKIKYGDFRDAVESICEIHNSKCKVDVIIKHIDAIDCLGQFDGYCFSADEDNLIDNRLSILLRKFDGQQLVKWRVYRAGSNHTQVVWDELTPHVLPTGGYAVPTNYGIKKYIELLYCHGSTMSYFNQFVQLTDEPIGLIMVHPSSHGVLSKLDSKSQVKESVDYFLNNKDNILIKPKYIDSYNKIFELYQSL